MASCRLHVSHKVVSTTGHRVVASPKPDQLVVPHLCACVQEHVANAKHSLLKLDRRNPYGFDVRLALRSTGGGL